MSDLIFDSVLFGGGFALASLKLYFIRSLLITTTTVDQVEKEGREEEVKMSDTVLAKS